MARLVEGQPYCDHHHAGAASELLHSCCTGRGQKLQVHHPEPGHLAHFVHQAVKHRRSSDVVCTHSSPLGGITAARAPRQRRCSLDERPGKHSSNNITQASSIKQRLRQRRFSIAIGESISLRTICEGQLEDVAAGWDQSPADLISNSSQHGTNSNSSSSGGSIQTLLQSELRTIDAPEQLDVRASSFYSSTASRVSTISRQPHGGHQQQHSFDRRPPCSPEQHAAAHQGSTWASHVAAHQDRKSVV